MVKPYYYDPESGPDDRLFNRPNCFTFQPAAYVEEYGALTSTRAGSAGGLYLRVDVEQYEYQIGGYAAGLKVGIHDLKLM